MRRYETIFITPPELPEEEQNEILSKVQSVLANLKGEVIKLEDWGTKKLGYEIRKNSRGHYYLLDFVSQPDAIRELERSLRLNDRILKYQTVRISDRLTPEAVQKLKDAASASKVVKISETAPGSETMGVEEEKKPAAEQGEEK